MYPPPRPPAHRSTGVPVGAVIAIAFTAAAISGLGGCAFGALIASTPVPASSSAAAKSTRPAKPTAVRSTRVAAPSFVDGTWRIGDDVPPGTYRATGFDLCVWERLSGFSGKAGDVIASKTVADGAAVVTIEVGDAGFSSTGCGTWKQVSEPTPTPTPSPSPEEVTSKPAPRKTKPKAPRATKAPQNDPRYSSCAKANSDGYGPYRRGVDPEYAWYQDRDGDGLVCERR